MHFLIRSKIISITFLAVFSLAKGNTNNDSIIINKFLNKSIKYFQNNIDSSIIFAEKALNLAEVKKHNQYISLSLQRLGMCYIEKEDHAKAIGSFIEALKIEETGKNELRIAELNNDLGYMYQIMENFGKSMKYHNTAFELFSKNNDTLGLIKTNHLIGNLHNAREFCEPRTDEQKQSDYRVALTYYQKEFDLSTKFKNEENIIKSTHAMANIFRKISLFQKSIEYTQIAIDYYRSKNNYRALLSPLRNMALNYSALQDYKKAVAYYKECENISLTHNLTGGVQYLYGDMASTYYLAKQYKEAYDYYLKYMILRDSIYNNEKSKQVFELETKYQTEKKEKEILSLIAERRKKNTYIAILISVFALIVTISIYSIIQTRNKRIIAEQNNRIAEQKIKELEKEKQLLATQSVLKGEEKERGRLARDLHDGLGGLLSGVKLKLSGLKENYVTSQDSIGQFDNAIDLLDNSIKELRRVAHNMMPESLVKFGLRDALQDFCEKIGSGKELQIHFHFFGENNRYEQTLETTVYRIAQELTNNAIKHSGASEIIVQLLQEPARVNLTVQDNGCGFDPTKVDTTKSSGLQNLKARAESFGGMLDMVSNPNEGTEISVEFKLG